MVAKCTAVLTKIVPTYPELGNVGRVSRVISKSNLAEVRIVIVMAVNEWHDSHGIHDHAQRAALSRTFGSSN